MEIAGRILIYSITGCQHCMRSKNTLQTHNLPFIDVNLDNFPHEREKLKARTGSNTVPQIFFNAFHVGGNAELDKKIANEFEWKELLEEITHKKAGEDAPDVPDISTAVDGNAVDFHCEVDEYAKLVFELKQSDVIKNHRSGLFSYSKTFSGVDFVNWLTKTRGLSEIDAVLSGSMLLESHFGHGVKDPAVKFKADNTLYRLLEDDESNALNAGVTSPCEPTPAEELGEIIRRSILKLYNEFLSADGKSVDYEGIGKSEQFRVGYMNLIQQLVRVKVSDVTREAKLAFFINIYNALVIHANIVRGPPTNLWQRYKFFNTVSYIIGGHSYSLQDIENGVLRANRKGVGQFFNPFGKSDSRLEVALREPEPLIHFALVCGAKSCPPIKTYSSTAIMSELKMAAEAFLESDEAISIVPHKRLIQLSMIFKWYRVDFGKNDKEVLQTISNYMAAGKKKTKLTDLINTEQFRISYMNYDWSVNSK